MYQLLFLGEVIVKTKFKVVDWANVSNANEAETDYERYSKIGPTSIDLKLLFELVSHIHTTTSKDEGILVFLPGIASIDRLSTAIEEIGWNDSRVIVLHSQVK